MAAAAPGITPKPLSHTGPCGAPSSLLLPALIWDPADPQARGELSVPAGIRPGPSLLAALGTRVSPQQGHCVGVQG